MEEDSQNNQIIEDEEEDAVPFNEVYVWGDDSCGQLGLCGLFPEKQQVHLSPKICSFNVVIKSIACGFMHTLFVSESGHVYSMGSNSAGQLGIGEPTVKSKNTPTLVETSPFIENVVVKVSCGNFHSLALTENGKVFSWGQGRFGALGHGRSDNLFAPFEVNLSS